MIKEDGTLWAVGTNTDGVQGTGDGIDHKTPKQVGTDTDWAYVTSVRFWGYTALAIKTDGTLWGWGSNSSNQLGTGNTGKTKQPLYKLEQTTIGKLSPWELPIQWL